MEIRRVLVGLILSGSFLLPAAARAVVDVAPVALGPGSTVNSLPNGFSSADSIAHTKLFDQTLAFSFTDGLTGTLRERVISYSDAPSAVHPGLYFDYEIGLTSGTVTAFTIEGYSNFDTFVKECGISYCGGSGANGISATSASRSMNGDQVTFNFGNALTSGEHSANLQIFSSASRYQDPLAFFADASGNTFSIDVVGPLASSVPEPSTWAMMVLGFCGLGFMACRKKGTLRFA